MKWITAVCHNVDHFVMIVMIWKNDMQNDDLYIKFNKGNVSWYFSYVQKDFLVTGCEKIINIRNVTRKIKMKSNEVLTWAKWVCGQINSVFIFWLKNKWTHSPENNSLISKEILKLFFGIVILRISS